VIEKNYTVATDTKYIIVTSFVMAKTKSLAKKNFLVELFKCQEKWWDF
jgi:hypothetical protein